MAGVPFNTDSSSGLPSAIVSRDPDMEGMSYAMLYDARAIGMEGAAQIERQSIRQPILKHRIQASLYYSRYRLGLQKLIGYPAARGHTILPTTPIRSSGRPTPVTSGRAAARPGVMGAPPRFRKALRLPVVNYDSQTYGS